MSQMCQMSYVAFGSRKKTHFEAASSKPLLHLRGLRGLKGRPRCLTSLSDPVKKQNILKQPRARGILASFEAVEGLRDFEAFEGFEGFEGFQGQAQMSNVAFGSRKKSILKQPRASPFWQVSRLLRDLRGLKGRSRCLTSLSDPAKKHVEAASSKPPLASFEGFEGFEGQAQMSNVAFGSR